MNVPVGIVTTHQIFRKQFLKIAVAQGFFFIKQPFLRSKLIIDNFHEGVHIKTFTESTFGYIFIATWLKGTFTMLKAAAQKAPERRLCSPPGRDL